MLRVAAVLTHPVQYYAPWFRWIAAHSKAIDLHVIYASSPTPKQQGAGFGGEFSWDVPLTDGYRSTIVRAARPGDRFDAAHFRGLDVPEIGGALAAIRPDVVVVFGWYSITLTRAIRTARRLGIPVLYHGDTNLQSAPRGWRRPLWVLKTRSLLDRFAGYLSVGVRSAAFFRFFGVPDGRIFPVPHAVDNDRFAGAAEMRRSRQQRAGIRRALGLPADGFVVLFAGKLEEKKRPLDLVEAASLMDPRPHLAVAGSGPMIEELKAAADRLGVGVTMLGFVNQSRMVEVYAAADCLAVPSDGRETWGLVVNEALASGLPSVVSDEVGCSPDLGGNDSGGVYPTEDPTARARELAAALESVRDRMQAGHDFTEACQARAAAHAFSVATSGLERACEAVKSREAVRRADVRVVACCGSMVLVGGLERMTFEVLRALRERGAGVHCIVNTWGHSHIVRLAEQIGASWSTGYYTYPFSRRFWNPVVAAQVCWDTLRTSAGLLRDAWWFQASHVLVSDYVTALRNGPALALLRLSGRKVVLRLGNAPDPGAFYQRVWRFGVAPLVDVIVCNSSFTDRELAAHGIQPSKRITIPHAAPKRLNGMNLENSVNPANAGVRDCRKVIYAGQILPGKGIDLVLDALGILVRRGQEVRADIIGHIDGWAPPENLRYREALRSRADAPDLRGRVRFLGYRDDIPRLMAGAGIHCLTSRADLREGFGIVVIEAKEAGIPSVVTRSGALPDLVTHGEDGWICGDETPEAVAEGIQYFLDGDRLARGMRSARASTAMFSRERFEQAWSTVFS